MGAEGGDGTEAGRGARAEGRSALGSCNRSEGFIYLFLGLIFLAGEGGTPGPALSKRLYQTPAHTHGASSHCELFLT